MTKNSPRREAIEGADRDVFGESIRIVVLIDSFIPALIIFF